MPDWLTDQVRTAVESGDAGSIVRAVRTARRWSLEQLAGRCAYSVSSLSRMERGLQPLRDVEQLRRIAAVLEVPPDLFGVLDTDRLPVRTPPSPARVGRVLAAPEEDGPMRRRTVLTGLVGLAGALDAPRAAGAVADPVGALRASVLDPFPATGRPVGLDVLRRALTAAHALFDRAEHLELAAGMPTLLATATATKDASGGAGATQAVDLLSRAHVLASELGIKLNEAQVAWTSAERARREAAEALDPLVAARAHRAWAIALRHSGHHELARKCVLDTADALRRELPGGGARLLAPYGKLLSTAAYTAAVGGDRDQALALIAEATAVAPDPVDVRLYEISVRCALGDYGTAVDLARRLDPNRVTPVERRARYWTDVAQALHGWGRHADSYRALRAAELLAPAEVRYRKSVRAVTEGLLRQRSGDHLPGLRALAARAGITG